MFATWSAPPKFDGDTFASAAGHLNRLVDCVLGLQGAYLAQSVPFSAPQPLQWGSFLGFGEQTGNWRRCYAGAIRHKKNTLEYELKVTADNSYDSEIRIQYGGNYTTVAIAAGSGSGQSITGSIDLSGYGLTADAFYRVNVDARNLSGGSPTADLGALVVRVVDLWESDGQSYGSLHAFTTGTPTVEEWQALSDRASTLYGQLRAPRAPFLGAAANRSGGTTILWRGTLTYLHPYLYYDTRIRPPWRYGTARVTLSIAGTDYTLGERSSNADEGKDPGDPALPEERFWEPPEGYGWDVESEFYSFRGAALDLSAQGLSVGQNYEVDVDFTHEGDGDMFPAAKLYLLFGQQPSAPTVGGWQSMSRFAYLDSVAGTGVMAPVRDNLALLSTLITYRNRVCTKARTAEEFRTGSFWQVRSHRWLHYRCEPREGEKLAPKLAFEGPDGAWEEVSLPMRPNEWLAYDLESVPYLWEGTIYRVKEANFVIEDVAP